MIVSNATFLLASLTDPGVIPRITTQRSTEEQNKYAPYMFWANQFYKVKQRNYYLMVNQGAMNSTPVLTQALKFCDTCLIYKPPRTVHCNVCDCCVRGFDHHCLWLGTCIGQRNYLYFLVYITCLNLTLPLNLYLAVHSLMEIADTNLKDLIVSFLLIIYALMMATILGFLLVLLCFHIHLMFINQTTYEKIKKLFLKVPFSPNPFNQKGFWRNLITRYRQQKRSDSVLTLLVEIIIPSEQKKQFTQTKLSRVVSEPNGAAVWQDNNSYPSRDSLELASLTDQVLQHVAQASIHSKLSKSNHSNKKELIRITDSVESPQKRVQRNGRLGSSNNLNGLSRTVGRINTGNDITLEGEIVDIDDDGQDVAYTPQDLREDYQNTITKNYCSTNSLVQNNSSKDNNFFDQQQVMHSSQADSFQKQRMCHPFVTAPADHSDKRSQTNATDLIKENFYDDVNQSMRMQELGELKSQNVTNTRNNLNKIDDNVLILKESDQPSTFRLNEVYFNNVKITTNSQTFQAYKDQRESQNHNEIAARNYLTKSTHLISQHKSHCNFSTIQQQANTQQNNREPELNMLTVSLQQTHLGQEDMEDCSESKSQVTRIGFQPSQQQVMSVNQKLSQVFNEADLASQSSADRKLQSIQDDIQKGSRKMLESSRSQQKQKAKIVPLNMEAEKQQIINIDALMMDEDDCEAARLSSLDNSKHQAHASGRLSQANRLSQTQTRSRRTAAGLRGEQRSSSQLAGSTVKLRKLPHQFASKNIDHHQKSQPNQLFKLDGIKTQISTVRRAESVERDIQLSYESVDQSAVNLEDNRNIVAEGEVWHTDLQQSNSQIDDSQQFELGIAAKFKRLRSDQIAPSVQNYNEMNADHHSRARREQIKLEEERVSACENSVGEIANLTNGFTQVSQKTNNMRHLKAKENVDDIAVNFLAVKEQEKIKNPFEQAQLRLLESNNVSTALKNNQMATSYMSTDKQTNQSPDNRAARNHHLTRHQHLQDLQGSVTDSVQVTSPRFADQCVSHQNQKKNSPTIPQIIDQQQVEEKENGDGDDDNMDFEDVNQVDQDQLNDNSNNDNGQMGHISERLMSENSNQILSHSDVSENMFDFA